MRQRPGAQANDAEYARLLSDLACGGASMVATERGGVGVLTGILPVTSARTICGPAVTVRSHAGDNLAVHRSIYEAEAGDIIVVANGGDTEVAVWGEVMTVAAQARGLAGLVTDGVVRDSGAIERLGLPVFARGVTPRGPRKEDAGAVNRPVELAGIEVQPGDFLVGDADGVVVVPGADAPAVAERCRRHFDRERALLDEVRAGGSVIELFGFDARIPTDLRPPGHRPRD